MKIKPNQYYGYFDYSGIVPTFIVLVIKPSGSKINDWIGSKNAKFSDLLCIDDYIIGHCDFTIDWSQINEN